MSALCKSRMDEGKSGKTGDLDSKNIGFLLIIREILLCDASHIFALNGFTHCDVCH